MKTVPVWSPFLYLIAVWRKDLSLSDHLCPVPAVPQSLLSLVGWQGPPQQWNELGEPGRPLRCQEFLTTCPFQLLHCCLEFLRCQSSQPASDHSCASHPGPDPILLGAPPGHHSRRLLAAHTVQPTV